MKIKILIISLSILFVSCGAVVKSATDKKASVEAGSIPPDFGKNNTGILFIKSHNSYNKYLEKNVKKYYNGKHQIVYKEDYITNSELRNTDNYRYIFDYDYESNNYWTTNVVHGYNTLKTGKVKRFFIVDIVTNKIYTLRLTSGFWSKLQQQYLQNLEKERKKNNS